MPDLIPFANLEVAYVKDALGSVQYCGDTATWSLPDLFNNTSTYVNGFVLDPTGDYIIQTPVNVPVDAGTSVWTLSAPVNFSNGVNQQSGKQFIYQGSQTGTNSALHSFVRDYDLGFELGLFRGAPTAPLAAGTAFNMYIEFSSGRSKSDYGLRLAFEYGFPIRLQGSFDDVNWTTLDTDDLNDNCEDYLTNNGRNILIDVVPLTSSNYYANLPYSADTSDPPPDIICVCINNNIILQFATDRNYLAAGKVKITATGGQWAVRYSDRKYLASAVFITNEIVRARPFQTNPECIFRGFAPSTFSGFVTPTFTDINRVYVSASVTASPVDSSGYASRTVILSKVEADFPPIYSGASSFLSIVNTTPIELTETHNFDQSTFSRRSIATVTIENNSGLYSPDSLIPAVRAARLTRGWIINADDGNTYNIVQTGITGLLGYENDGFHWGYSNKSPYVTLSISDLFRRGDSDTGCIGYVLPYDGQCHYYAVRDILTRMGITPDRMNFPYCQRNSPCPHYHLPQGTNANPALHFQPQTSMMSALLQIRGMSGEQDFSTGQILPMYLYCSTEGEIEYYPAPIGLVNQWLNPDFSVSQNSINIFNNYSAVPNFNGSIPNLNEFVSNLGSTASLSNIRTPIIFEGLNFKSGNIIAGSSYNPFLGINGDPNTPGYIGADSPVFNISRLFSSQQAVQQALAVATIQTSFPAVRTSFSAHFQAGLFPLMAIGVQDYKTQGNSNPVVYYVTNVTNRMSLTDRPSATSQISARLLGQAN